MKSLKNARSRKFFCCLLVFAVLFTQIVSGFAQVDGTNRADVKKIRGFGKTIYTVTEGDIQNVLVVEDNGQMYIDGHRISVKTTRECNAGIVPYSTYTVVVDKPPAGTTASDYSQYLGTDSHVVTFTDVAIENISITVVALACSQATGISSSLWEVSLSGYWNLWKQSTTYGKSLSMKIARYQHKNGAMIDDFTKVEKLVTTCYANENFTGYLGRETWYKKWVYR